MYQNGNKPIVNKKIWSLIASAMLRHHDIQFLETMTTGHSGYSSLKPEKCGNDKLTGMNPSDSFTSIFYKLMLIHPGEVFLIKEHCR